MNPESQKQTRHGKRAEGKTQTSITMSEELLNRAKEAAAKDGRSLSNWIEQLIKKSAPLILIGFTAAHLMPCPSVRSVNELAVGRKETASFVACLNF